VLFSPPIFWHLIIIYLLLSTLKHSQTGRCLTDHHDAFVCNGTNGDSFRLRGRGNKAEISVYTLHVVKEFASKQAWGWSDSLFPTHTCTRTHFSVAMETCWMGIKATSGRPKLVSPPPGGKNVEWIKSKSWTPPPCWLPTFRQLLHGLQVLCEMHF